MRWLSMAVGLALSGAALWAADEKGRTFRFNKEHAGKVPAGWKADKTGTGEGSVWKVVADDTAPSKSGHALAQTAESPRAMFNLCVAEDTSFKDVEVSVDLKSVQGKVDQGGGVVWRYQDANNYYVARVNPLELNYRVYKVIAGRRTQLETEESVKAPKGEWHTLKVRHAGDKIECYLGDKKVLEAADDAIQKAGKVGLWTKADAQTHFDNFQVRDLGK